MSDAFVSQVGQKVAEEVAGMLVKGAVKMVGRIFSAQAVREPTEEHVIHLEGEEFDRLFGSIFDPYAEPAACADDFLQSLQSCNDQRVCQWCEPDLFHDVDRKAGLLDTLAAARPASWQLNAYQHPSDPEEHAALPWLGLDYEIHFNIDGEKHCMQLLIWMVRYGDGWAVWGLDWSDG